MKGSPEFVCQNNISTEVRAERLSMKDHLIPIIYYALHQGILEAILSGMILTRFGQLFTGRKFPDFVYQSGRTYRAFTKIGFFRCLGYVYDAYGYVGGYCIPVATYLEVDSVEQPWHYPIVSVQQKVAQVGESWPDGKILNELAGKLGFHDMCGRT